VLLVPVVVDARTSHRRFLRALAAEHPQAASYIDSFQGPLGAGLLGKAHRDAAREELSIAATIRPRGWDCARATSTGRPFTRRRPPRCFWQRRLLRRGVRQRVDLILTGSEGCSATDWFPRNYSGFLLCARGPA
jgi:hypothetical protein